MADLRTLTQADVDQMVESEVNIWRPIEGPMPWDAIAYDVDNMINRMIRRDTIDAPKDQSAMIEKAIDEYIRGEAKFGSACLVEPN